MDIFDRALVVSIKDVVVSTVLELSFFGEVVVVSTKVIFLEL